MNGPLGFTAHYLFVVSNQGLEIYCVCLFGQEMAPSGQRRLFKDILGAKMMIMWEEQLVDPPITYINNICKYNVILSIVLTRK